uniref:Ovule protein n=1 Tax=Panagrellus redivivus TaxID=6233 RepID=A0A7E4V986_PANRE
MQSGGAREVGLLNADLGKFLFSRATTTTLCPEATQFAFFLKFFHSIYPCTMRKLYLFTKLIQANPKLASNQSLFNLVTVID